VLLLCAQQSAAAAAVERAAAQQNFTVAVYWVDHCVSVIGYIIRKSRISLGHLLLLPVNERPVFVR
jgi:hypothetical protein